MKAKEKIIQISAVDKQLWTLTNKGNIYVMEWSSYDGYYEKHYWSNWKLIKPLPIKKKGK